MQQRRLGNSDIWVAELAFGAWGIGGRTEGATSYGATDDAVSLRALRHAVCSGITLFDTSNIYGSGHSEVLLGRAFKSDRPSVVIATKVGWPTYTGPADFSAAGMRKSVEGSLSRLQTDYIDLLQLHNPPLDSSQTRDEILAALQGFVAEGKVRALGVSVRSPAEAALLADQPALVAIQANFNMMDTRVVGSGLLSNMQESGRALLARTPLCFGFLSGRIDRNTRFAEGDHRAAWSPTQRERWIEGGELFAAMVDRHGAGPLHEAALRFCLSFPGVAAVLSGMMTEEEVAQNVAAANKGPLPAPLVEEILELNRQTEFFERGAVEQGAAKASTLVKKA